MLRDRRGSSWLGCPPPKGRPRGRRCARCQGDRLSSILAPLGVTMWVTLKCPRHLPSDVLVQKAEAQTARGSAKAWRPPNKTLCRAVCALRVPARFAPWVPAELMSPERARESQSALGWKGTQKDVKSDPTSLPQPHISATTPGVTVRMHEVGRDRCFPPMCPRSRWGRRQHHECHLVPPASPVGTPWAGKLEEAAPRWEEKWGQCVTCRPCTSLGGDTLSGCWH